MSWTKRQYIEQAFEELGLAAYLYDLTAEQLNSALYRLDAMMASWVSKGIFVCYPAPVTPQDSVLDEDTGVPDWANEAIILNFALKLAPSYGKTVSDQTKVSAKQAYDALLTMTNQTYLMQWPSSMPAGAGYRKRGFLQPFLPRPDTNPITTAENGNGIFRNT
jgi:hypothetical protein